MKSRRKRETFVCPHCGHDVPIDALACRECGSDNETGWSEGADVWDAGIPGGYGPEEDFDYDEFIDQEMPRHQTHSPGKALKRWGWSVLVAIVALAFVSYMLNR